jgi:hypothetical protein
MLNNFSQSLSCVFTIFLALIIFGVIDSASACRSNLECGYENGFCCEFTGVCYNSFESLVGSCEMPCESRDDCPYNFCCDDSAGLCTQCKPVTVRVIFFLINFLIIAVAIFVVQILYVRFIVRPRKANQKRESEAGMEMKEISGEKDSKKQPLISQKDPETNQKKQMVIFHAPMSGLGNTFAWNAGGDSSLTEKPIEMKEIFKL